MLFYSVTCFVGPIYWVTLICNIVTSKGVLNSAIVFTLNLAPYATNDAFNISVGFQSSILC